MMQVPYNITLFENITKLRRWVVKDSLTLLQEGGFIKIENDFITLLIEKEEAYEVKTLIPKLLNLYPVQFKLFLFRFCLGCGLFYRTGLDCGLRCSKTGNGHAERRAAHIVEAHLVAERNRCGLTALLAADADFQVLAG